MNSFRGRLGDRLFAILLWIVNLLIVDEHNLAFIDEFVDLLLASTARCVRAFLQVIGYHIAFDCCLVPIQIDLRRIIEAEEVWPETFLNCLLIRLVFEQI